MKLLLDQNLSHRIVEQLSRSYPGTVQMSLLEMGESLDKDIWVYAKEHDYAIVTLDADFHEYSVLWGGPPLVIWLRCGNKPKNVILNKLLDHKTLIEDAASDANTWCVEIY